MVLATLSQPSTSQVLFNGKEFRVRANEEENDGRLKLIGRLDAPDGVELYNEWEIASKYSANTISISPDSDNTGGTPVMEVNASIKATAFLNSDGTPVVSLEPTPYFTVVGTDLVFGTSASAYRYDSTTNSLYLTNGAPGSGTWDINGGDLQITTS